MSTNDIQCGSIARLPVAKVADKAARTVMEFHSPRAICIDPAGRVSVEFPDTCCAFDLVGVYTPSLGLLELTRRIGEDLEFEGAERGFWTKRRAA